MGGKGGPGPRSPDPLLVIPNIILHENMRCLKFHLHYMVRRFMKCYALLAQHIREL